MGTAGAMFSRVGKFFSTAVRWPLEDNNSSNEPVQDTAIACVNQPGLVHNQEEAGTGPAAPGGVIGFLSGQSPRPNRRRRAGGAGTKVPSTRNPRDNPPPLVPNGVLDSDDIAMIEALLDSMEQNGDFRNANAEPAPPPNGGDDPQQLPGEEDDEPSTKPMDCPPHRRQMGLFGPRRAHTPETPESLVLGARADDDDVLPPLPSPQEGISEDPGSTTEPIILPRLIKKLEGPTRTKSIPNRPYPPPDTSHIRRQYEQDVAKFEFMKPIPKLFPVEDFVERHAAMVQDFSSRLQQSQEATNTVRHMQEVNIQRLAQLREDDRQLEIGIHRQIRDTRQAPTGEEMRRRAQIKRSIQLVSSHLKTLDGNVKELGDISTQVVTGFLERTSISHIQKANIKAAHNSREAEKLHNEKKQDPWANNPIATLRGRHMRHTIRPGNFSTLMPRPAPAGGPLTEEESEKINSLAAQNLEYKPDPPNVPAWFDVLEEFEVLPHTAETPPERYVELIDTLGSLNKKAKTYGWPPSPGLADDLDGTTAQEKLASLMQHIDAAREIALEKERLETLAIITHE